MAGHSKWANIQHRKNSQDAKRGKLFTKLIREITVAARSGDPDPAANPRLRTAVEKALVANMTRDTIDRASKRGSGAIEGEHYEEVRYEGYGPGGAAVLVDCMTNNRNRTASDVRYAFSKYGGNLGTDGSVAYLFSKLGVLNYPPGSDEDAIMEAALGVGAQDIVSSDDGSVEVLTDPADFERVRDALVAADLIFDSAEVTMRPSTSVALDAEAAAAMVKMLDVLEDLDDVQQVYSSADIAEDILAQL